MLGISCSPVGCTTRDKTSSLLPHKGSECTTVVCDLQFDWVRAEELNKIYYGLSDLEKRRRTRQRRLSVRVNRTKQAARVPAIRGPNASRYANPINEPDHPCCM